MFDGHMHINDHVIPSQSPRRPASVRTVHMTSICKFRHVNPTTSLLNGMATISSFDPLSPTEQPIEEEEEEEEEDMKQNVPRRPHEGKKNRVHQSA